MSFAWATPQKTCNIFNTGLLINSLKQQSHRPHRLFFFTPKAQAYSQDPINLCVYFLHYYFKTLVCAQERVRNTHKNSPCKTMEEKAQPLHQPKKQITVQKRSSAFHWWKEMLQSYHLLHPHTRKKESVQWRPSLGFLLIANVSALLFETIWLQYAPGMAFDTLHPHFGFSPKPFHCTYFDFP